MGTLAASAKATTSATGDFIFIGFCSIVNFAADFPSARQSIPHPVLSVVLARNMELKLALSVTELVFSS
jgi:hypothetical protein